MKFPYKGLPSCVEHNWIAGYVLAQENEMGHVTQSDLVAGPPVMYCSLCGFICMVPKGKDGTYSIPRTITSPNPS